MEKEKNEKGNLIHKIISTLQFKNIQFHLQ